MRVGGLCFCVMLCGRGLRTSHIHRPITTFLFAKIQFFTLMLLFFYKKFHQFAFLNIYSYLCSRKIKQNIYVEEVNKHT